MTTLTVTPPYAEPEPLVGLDLVLELAALERPAWSSRALGLVAAGVPTMMADDDADASGADDAAGDSDDDDDADAAGAGDDDDDEADDLAAARKAAAAANRELRRLKAEQSKAADKAKADAGKWQELAEKYERELEDLRGSIDRDKRTRVAEAALRKAKAKNPAAAVRLLDLDDVEDDTSAERAVKRLQRSDAYLFDTAPSRQKRGAGGSGSDADDDTDRPRRPVNRLRRGLEATPT